MTMQSRYEVHIVANEWRWISMMSSLLILIGFLPFVSLLARNDGTQQFMGAMGVNYIDTAAYLGRINQGVQGSWGTEFWHTPEPMPPFGLLVYPLLGHAAAIANLNPAVMFHLARIGATIFMCIGLYHLAATIWSKIRARRIFFVVAAVGGGLGWLFLPLLPDALFLDISVPEVSPFFSSIVNVHFPLAFACLALLASVLILAFRPGNEDFPSLYNGGLSTPLLVVLLGILYPHMLGPLTIALGGVMLGAMVSGWQRTRRILWQPLMWWVLVAIPTLMIAAYYIVMTNASPILTEWNAQNFTPAPPPHVLLIGLGLPLLLALPSVWRAVRRLEQDGDQLMLLWLVAMIVLMYIPFSAQRRFGAGLMLLIAYFATRAIEDVWLNYIPHRARLAAGVFGTLAIAMSYVVVLVLVSLGNVGMLPREYPSAFVWLQDNAQVRDVVLAAPDVSLWLPGWAGMKVVYGHPFETLNAREKEFAVIDWYSNPNADCQALLNGEGAFDGLSYSVRFVLVGPVERALGDDPNSIESPCLNELVPLVSVDGVEIYGRP
jgi:hypothetical protein